jgi:hypothetical protein
MSDFLVLAVGAVVLAVIGIRVGMLLAPRMERWGAPRDADERDGRPR